MTNRTYSYTEDDLIQLSALQHFMFCERQCALIHIEQLWSENLFTAEGRVMHDKVDTANKESRRNIRIEYGVPMRSLRLGLIGKADVVEFHKHGDKWIPFPVEYKRGKPKSDNCDKVQLCAQALCLEEMLNVEIPEGSLFYGQTRRREDVGFDKALRMETEEAAKKVHELIESGITPKAEYSAKCKKCSLVELCLPKASKKASSYLMKAIEGE
ncbi:MAG TPA: CRISPR-associated protein Cas4 [Candidatus Wujingus californicus]|uniref:CRISPR-associated protein Cas4 n=1 Tax=Candidatus Wujingus californicus TaxID=3367618 RepID=UPI001DC45AA6|nr:CRISPR-associated protein Cas4 [Planctomycetota bacterium]MDO8094727.1 CRISPR-associated protein Cas4 [Candidatus Brocadiales bacterium]